MPQSSKKYLTALDLLSDALCNPTHIDEQIQKDRESRTKFREELEKAYEQGVDISEYVWPREWELRERPKPHHASNIISLTDAIELCGQHFYGDIWDAKDWYARSPEEMEQWRPEHGFYMAWSFILRKKGADFTNRQEEERQAFIRKQKVYGKLSSWLNQKTIEAFILDSEGNKNFIPSNVWLSCEALGILDSGKVYEGKDGKKTRDKSDVYLNKEQFENHLQNNPLKIEKKLPIEAATNEHEGTSQKKISADLNIIGALLGLLLGKSSSGVPYSQFETQQSIIDAIHANYGKEHGLSQRNLESKFSQAKEKLKEKP